MNCYKHLCVSFCGIVCTGLSAASVDVPTPVPLPTQVQPQLNVEIGKETEQITFVNTNNDPYVYTKVYRLKHADPYEIRPYVMAAIRSRRVNSNVTKVEAIKYQDGTGMLLVSAEEYRFHPVENGMALIRSLPCSTVRTLLPKPGGISSSIIRVILIPSLWRN